MAAPPLIGKLVERFERNRVSYQAAEYRETQLRREFLDPLFGLDGLGWDIDNEHGHAEAYKDVIHEDAIKIGGATKAPDYCFRIGGRRIFFLEAKKPSVNLRDDVSAAFQVRRYAWSAKLPLSILSDFEELAVYDCRVKPDKTDRPSVGRVLLLTYDQYVDRWDELAGVFSRDAVLKGSFDKFAESTKLKRGTAEVDTAFLEEIESWRETLAKNLALRNDLNQRDLNFAVQRTIDRLIFLRMCEDRGIETYGQLMKLLNGESVYRRLLDIYDRADERYNSGLFHFRPEKGRLEPPDELTTRLALDDKPLKEIIRGLYYPDSPYEFSVLPAEILGQVYEQFLGKVIRLTPGGHRAVVEDKPEVKKAGGVFYTPAYIVDYIVRETVGKLVEGKTPKQVSKLRVLDPACGSGSFLVGAFHFLLDWHRDWYVEDGTARHTKEIYQGAGGQCLLTTAEKKRILLNNIYGVDIDSQAVEVTKLSLLLKVLERENRETLERQLRLLHERALPDLGGNIKCGNSLIGPDFYDQRQMTLLDEEEQYRINAFDWNAEFPEVFKGKDGGFDAVIGNPPYGAYLSEEERSYLATRYHFQSYQADSYLLFLEQSIRNFLRANGQYGMIIPNPWLTNLLQTAPRRFVVSSARVVEIVHFRFPVFKQATVDTEVVILQRAVPSGWTAKVTVAESVASFHGAKDAAPLRTLSHAQQKWVALDGGVINIFLTAAEEDLAAKCKAAGVALGQLFQINVGIKPYQVGKGTPPQSREIVDSRPFDSQRRLTSMHRPYLRGADIRRFQIAPLEPRYIKYGRWLAEPRPAANFDAPRKIVMRQTGDSLVAAIDEQQYLCLNNMHVLVPRGDQPSLEYVLGIVNSKLMNWYYHTLNPEVGEALAEVKKSNVAILPIVIAEDGNRSDGGAAEALGELVQRIIALQENLGSARNPEQRTRLERQIEDADRRSDRLVYEIYALTDKEIHLVESAMM